MSDVNPYEVSDASKSEAAPMVTRRSKTEWVVLASLAGFPVYWGVLLATGRMALRDREAIDLGVVAAFCLLGVAALTLLWFRRRAGSILAILFYAMQLGVVVFPSGLTFAFASLPRLPLREMEPLPGLLIQINLVAIACLLLSLRIHTEYRMAAEPQSALS